jgi:tetratricopeptide (TPR) repeat protein
MIEGAYHQEVTGNLDEARKSLDLCIQTYPRFWVPHDILGSVWDMLGQYDKEVAERREAIRLNPADSLDYRSLAVVYMSLDRFDEANAIVKEASVKNLGSSFVGSVLYSLAFLQNDKAEMARQVALVAGKPGEEDALPEMEADTAAYSGHLRDAREFSRRAAESARQAGEKETAGTYTALSALRDALFGDASDGRKRAASAAERSAGHDGEYVVALSFAYSGDDRRGETLADDLEKKFPEDTIMLVQLPPHSSRRASY